MEKDLLVKSYMDFLNNGKTERECVSQIIEAAQKAGYKDLAKSDGLSAGSKVYFQKMNKAVVLFNIGSSPLESGLNILGAHIDSPRLDIKQNPLYEKDSVVYLNTHYYGGIKKYQWLTIPLALHGVVCKKDGSVVTIKIGEDENDPVFYISDILIHLAHDQLKKNASEFIDAEDMDLLAGSAIPEKDNKDSDKDDKKQKDKAKKAVLDILSKKYGISEEDFQSAELEAVPAGKARDLGFDRSLIMGYGHDDRSCAFPSLMAMLDVPSGTRTNCLICVDKEEIGSVGATGMASQLFENAISEVVARMGTGYSELTLRRALQNSMMISSDVNAAYDPLNAALFDKDNASQLGAGLVFNKYTGSRGKSGASDANAEFIAHIRRVLDDAKVSYQMAELGKVERGGGGTIAYHCAKYGMSVIDAGVSVLSMHAPWEVISKEDLWQAYLGYRAFLSDSRAV